MNAAAPARSARALALVAAGLALWGLLDAAGLWASPLIDQVERLVEDRRAAAFAPVGAETRIAIVDIDERSLAAVGRWPWGRDQVAVLVQRLFDEAGARALAFDLVFPEPQRPTPPLLDAAALQDAVLAARLQAWRDRLDADARLVAALKGRPVALGAYLTADRGGQRQGALPQALFPLPEGTPGLPRWNGFGANLPALRDAAPAGGFFNYAPDADGLVRSVPLVASLDGQGYPSLTLSLALLGDPGSRVQPLWGRASGSAPPPLLGLRWEGAAGDPRPARIFGLGADGAVRVPFGRDGGPGRSRIAYYSALDVLQGRLAPQALRGQLVLVGTSAPGQADLRPTPIHPAMPGVEVHAHVLAGLLDGRLPHRPDWAAAWQALCVLAVAALGALVARRLAVLPATLAFLALGGLVVGGNVWAFARQGWALPLAAPLLVGAGLGLFALLQATWRERQRRRATARLFARYVPPEVAQAMARDPTHDAMEADNRELTVLFCDLRGFSGVAQTLAPQQLRALINLYFSRMTEVVHAHGGTLDKFIGDAVMAFWGAPRDDPQHARHALQAAQAMLHAVGPLNESLRAQGLPPVAVGIGLATGVVCVGDLGSAVRRSYTAVGDAVNVAARVEALTRQFDVPLLVADSTRAACIAQAGTGRAGHWLEVADLPVKGREGSVKLFTPTSERPAQIDTKLPPAAADRLAPAPAHGQDPGSFASSAPWPAGALPPDGTNPAPPPGSRRDPDA